MAPASSSIEIAASAERVWAIVGGFDNLATWLDIIRSSTLEDGGRVRRREAVNGAVIVERLLSFDDAERRYSYCHVQAPDPVTGYVAEMCVEAGRTTARDLVLPFHADDHRRGGGHRTFRRHLCHRPERPQAFVGKGLAQPGYLSWPV